MGLKMNKFWIFVLVVLILGIPICAVKLNDSSITPYKIGSTRPVANNMYIILHSNKIYSGKLNATNAKQYNITSKPKNGKLTVDKNGKFNYTPNKNFVGNDTFKYMVKDGKINSNIATVTINIKNIPPVSKNINFDTKVNTPYNGKLNCIDRDKDNLIYKIVSPPVNGTLKLNNNGTYTYIPNKGFHGKDMFTYNSNDGISNSNTASVEITIINNLPVANNMDIKDSLKNEYTGKLSATDQDNDALTYKIISKPKNGKIKCSNNGEFSYRPSFDFRGTDTFTYLVNDGYNDSNIATVKITKINILPIANDISVKVPSKKEYIGYLNGSDMDGDALNYIIQSKPQHGTLKLDNNGEYRYKANENYHSNDSFTYKVYDGYGYSNIAIVNITVNTPPKVYDRSEINNYITHDWHILDGRDADGDKLIYKIVKLPKHGKITNHEYEPFNGANSYVYTRVWGYSGMDSLTYLANDGYDDSNIAKVKIDVRGI